MIEGTSVNFNNTTDNRRGIEYDYGSIMHYGENEFSKDLSLDSIVPKKEGVVIGQRAGLSDTDRRSVNRLYCDCDESDVKKCDGRKKQ